MPRKYTLSEKAIEQRRKAGKARQKKKPMFPFAEDRGFASAMGKRGLKERYRKKDLTK